MCLEVAIDSVEVFELPSIQIYAELAKKVQRKMVREFAVIAS
jgi:hypothetical protein